MKIKLLIICSLFIIIPWRGIGQGMPTDSMVVKIAAFMSGANLRIPKKVVPVSDYGMSFYIEDIATRQPIEKQGYGIYEFGFFGDDVERWLMWYDTTGYRIYQQSLNTEMLGDILEYMKRNKYSDSKSFKYIKGLYFSAHISEDYGEKEIK